MKPVIELPFLRQRSKKEKRRAAPPGLESRLRERLEEARVGFMAARTELTALFQSFKSELGSHLKEYAIRNVLREIKKDPETFQRLDDDQQAVFREELNLALEAEIPAVIEQLKNDPEWYDEDKVFLDEKSKAWKTIKALDSATNRVMRKYGLGAVNTVGWTWLSESLNDLAAVSYPAIKKNYAEKKKALEYMERRVEEEARLGQVSRGMGELFSE